MNLNVRSRIAGPSSWGRRASGKTTLLTIMGCLREVHAGSVRLLDQELFAAGEISRSTCVGAWDSSSRPITCMTA